MNHFAPSREVILTANRSLDRATTIGTAPAVALSATLRTAPFGMDRPSPATLMSCRTAALATVITIRPIMAATIPNRTLAITLMGTGDQALDTGPPWMAARPAMLTKAPLTRHAPGPAA